MTAAERYPSYRAPQANREILCVPPWETLAQWVPAQRESIDRSAIEISGMPLSELSQMARCRVVQAASDFTNAYATPKLSGSADGPLVITGHQPGWVHPGVWLKNFAAARLAKQLNGTAISLIIDNDLCRAPSIRVPTGKVEQPQVVDVAFDEAQPEMPYEERRVADSGLWRSFGERVSKAVSSLIPNPMISEWWDETAESCEELTNVGLTLARARHRLELAWGSQSLELPQSKVCQAEPFHRFALHLLAHASQFREAYNGALAEYRHVHRLRSDAQPVPDLQESAGWIETPFWIWTEQDTTRRALFVRLSPSGLQLSDRVQWSATLSLATSSNYETPLRQFAAWEQAGVKIRTRALTTTLYARLFLADTFIHGIGGAKYDQVTDKICEHFLGISLPPYIALSGTLRLPIDHELVSPSCPAELHRLLRELRYHPETHIRQLDFPRVNQTELDELITLKRRWIQTPKTVENAANRHRQINFANESLQAWLQPQREKLERELALALSQTRTNRLLESREYPFCLFPLSVLQDFLLDFSP